MDKTIKLRVKKEIDNSGEFKVGFEIQKAL
jgi:hypothetical protein